MKKEMGLTGEFIEDYKAVGKAFGLDDLFLTIIAKLFIEPKEMPMDELAKQTGYSLASISNRAGILQSMGFIRKTRKPNSKKIYLYMEKDMLNIIKEHFLKKEEHGIKEMKPRLCFLINKYKKNKISKKDKEKVRILEGYYRDLETFEGLIKEFVQRLEKLKEVKRNVKV